MTKEEIVELRQNLDKVKATERDTFIREHTTKFTQLESSIAGICAISDGHTFYEEPLDFSGGYFQNVCKYCKFRDPKIIKRPCL
jgi:hypothetical protein